MVLLLARNRWTLALRGLFGVAAFAWPGLTLVALALLLGLYALVDGAFALAVAVRLREEMEGEWLLAPVGLLSVGFGLALALWPGAGALALVWLIGAYALCFGILLLVLAFRLRAWARQLPLLGT